MIDILLDALLDVLKLIPFLYLSFVIMELIEHKLNNQKKLDKINKFGPIAGSTLGIIPQCGFSALASNLYAARVITLGTLFSIYLSTSDEMLPILISHQSSIKEIILLLSTKFAIGLVFGIIIDLIYQKRKKEDIQNICMKDNCHCEKNIFVSSLIHTLKISLFIFIINIILNTIIDESVLMNFTKNNKILSPIITALIGLIPNCAGSVVITELYLDRIITFGSCISGLLSSSGVGLLILFKQNKNIKENIMILLILLLISITCGIIFNIV